MRAGRPRSGHLRQAASDDARLGRVAEGEAVDHAGDDQRHHALERAAGAPPRPRRDWCRPGTDPTTSSSGQARWPAQHPAEAIDKLPAGLPAAISRAPGSTGQYRHATARYTCAISLAHPVVGLFLDPLTTLSSAALGSRLGPGLAAAPPAMGRWNGQQVGPMWLGKEGVLGRHADVGRERHTPAGSGGSRAPAPDPG